MNELIYVYCLSNTPPDPGPGDGPAGLRYISAGGFFIVVKTVGDDEFSEENLKKNLADLSWLETNVREHIDVINRITEQNIVIPFKFGTIFKTEDGLEKFIDEYGDSLVENLLYVEWKEEWAVKIYCDRKILCTQIDELSAGAADLEKQIMASSPGKAFLLKRKKSDLVGNEMDRLCKIYGQEYYDEFLKLSDAARLSNLLPMEFSGRQDEMILNVAYLVSRERVVDLVSSVRFLKKRYGGLGFDIELTGPWPPFSFISIKEKT